VSPEFSTTVATSLSDWQIVRRLREDSFARGDEESVFSDACDGASNCWSFILWPQAGERAIGSIRACVYAESFDWLPIPALDLYGEELAGRPEFRSGMVQATHFCIAPTSRDVALLPKLLLFRAILQTAVRERCGHVVAIVKNQPAHLKFHTRMGLTRIGPAKFHPMARREAVLMSVTTDRFLSAVRADKVFRPIGEFDEQAVAHEQSRRRER
jgi:hypothetical protein